MPAIYDEVVLECCKEDAFKEISTVAFMKSIDPNFGRDTIVLVENRRLIRSVSRVKGIGDVEIERVMFPEVSAIVTHRRPPLGPFTYQLSIQLLTDHKDGCLLRWTNEFELNEENRPRQEAILGYIRKNDRENLVKIRLHFAQRKQERSLS